MPCCLARAPPVRQRTQAGDLRGRPAGSGLVAPRGAANVGGLRHEPAAAREPPPEQVAGMTELPFTRIAMLSARITGQGREIRIRAGERSELKRLMTIPGIGPVGAMAVHALAPPMARPRGRDFAARARPTPREQPAAGRQLPGRITRMRQRDPGQLPVPGQAAVTGHRRESDLQNDPWLRRMISGKPVVAVALAGRMARIIRALSASGENTRAPAAMAAAK